MRGIAGNIGTRAVAIFVVGTALLARLTTLRTWWCLDDWGQLSRAAGYSALAGGFPARVLSQHIWWSLVWPVFGLNAAYHAVLRIFVHAAGALAVVSIGRRSGLNPARQLIGGVLFAALPVSFTILYWASGIQELLAGVLALWSVERWLAKGRCSAVVSGLLAVCSILAKESGLGLPVLFAALMLTYRNHCRCSRAWRWAIIVVVLAVALLEATLIWHHFATGPGDRYATAGFMVMVGNLGKYGWWLPTLGPVYMGQVTWSRAWVGIGFLSLWGVLGGISWRNGKRLPAFALFGGLLSVAPTLPLVHQVRPYMAYVLAASASLAIASLLPSLRRISYAAAISCVLIAVAWGNITMAARISRPDGAGIAADPIVRAVDSSRQAARELRRAISNLELTPGSTVVVFQPNIRRSQAHTDLQSGLHPFRSGRYQAHAGPLGASLIAGGPESVLWTSALLDLPPNTLVVCETASDFEAWGRMDEAVLYAAELHLAVGEFVEVLDCLHYVLEAFGPDALHLPPASGVGLPVKALARQRAAFERFLIRTAIDKEISGDQFMFYSECLRLNDGFSADVR